LVFSFFSCDPASPHLFTLSLHDALPISYSTFGRIKNTDWLYSSDYWRLRNVTFGYNFRDVRLAGKSRLNSGRLYLTLENFWGKRSEEHTSELQSRENLVCRLLLEKKKKK